MINCATVHLKWFYINLWGKKFFCMKLIRMPKMTQKSKNPVSWPTRVKKTPDVPDLFKTTVIQILLQIELDFAKTVLFFLNSIVQLILHTLWLWLHLANFWYDHSSIHFFSHLSNYKDCTDLKVVILRSHFKVYMRKKMVFFLMWKLQFNWSLAVFLYFFVKSFSRKIFCKKQMPL